MPIRDRGIHLWLLTIQTSLLPLRISVAQSTQAPGTEDLGDTPTCRSHVKAGLTGSGLLALVNDQAGHSALATDAGHSALATVVRQSPAGNMGWHSYPREN